MIRFVFYSIMFLFITSKAFAQTNENINSEGTFFENSPSNYKGWINTNGPGYTHANYRLYDGTTYVTIKPKQNLKVKFICRAEVLKGQLGVELIGAENELINKFSFNENSSSEILLDLKEDVVYKLKFIGFNTKGSYKCNWSEIQ